MPVEYKRRMTFSKITLPDYQGTNVYPALMALPRRHCGPSTHGVRMTNYFYEKNDKNARYVEFIIKAHKQLLRRKDICDTWEPMTYEIFRIVAANHAFTTYDKIEEILRKRGYEITRDPSSESIS